MLPHIHTPLCWTLDKILNLVLNQWESCVETLNDFISWMEAATKEAHSALTQAADDTAHFYDTHHKEAPLYEVGDKVISWNAYRIKLPPSFGQIHPVFSVILLWPYNIDAITKQVKHNPPPIVCDGVEEYEVESILDSQIFWGKLEYLVWWKGYGIEEDGWRPSDVKGARRLITKFHRRNPEAPQHISAIDFSNLPFHPLTNFMDTLDTVPSGWATGQHTLGHCTFEGGVNVRVHSL